MKYLFSSTKLLNHTQRQTRLKWLTSLFFVLLIVPICSVFYLGYTQYQNDVLNEYQQKTKRATENINKRIFKRIALANATPPSHFDYVHALYNPTTQQVSNILSPLSSVSSIERYSGHLGFFQLDKEGQFNSPLWPHPLPASDANQTKPLGPDEQKRLTIATRLYEITQQSPELSAQIKQQTPNEHIKFGVIDELDNYFILHRVVESMGQIKVQGYVIEREAYINNIILDALNTVALDQTMMLTLTSKHTKDYFLSEVNQQQGVNVSQLNEPMTLHNQVLINSESLNWPYKEYQIHYSTASLPISPTALFGATVMVILLLAICLACIGFYVIGVKQLKLAEQRLNFVSAVSHELKTPLTSIRMYAEMLKTGMVISTQHQADYYEFIFSESERLSRLIDNILQLTKLSQPAHNVNAQYINIGVLSDIVRSKTSSLLAENNFTLNINYDFDNAIHTPIFVDSDAFSQIIINITDNAIKFFDKDEINDMTRQKIDVCFSQSDDKNSIEIKIRDYGVGITAEQQNKIFDLFYRGGSELTRKTQGTGIGLALVSELVNAQQGKISVTRKSPGLEITMRFLAQKNHSV